MSNLNARDAACDKGKYGDDANCQRRSQELNPLLNVRITRSVPPVGREWLGHEECDGEREERIQPTDEQRSHGEKEHEQAISRFEPEPGSDGCEHREHGGKQPEQPRPTLQAIDRLPLLDILSLIHISEPTRLL